ncbi:hypothetical protein MKW92_008587 [Papaver armeniacum]|nr:hypothetical protein MKW92_008587 [Papaver armeniacum]
MEKREEEIGIAQNQIKTSSSNGSKFPLTFWEVTIALTVVSSFILGLLGVYLTLPASDYSFLKLPRSLEDLQLLRDHLEDYTSDYTVQVLTFMIPGTVFMSLFAGALFGVVKGVALVVFAATAGASSCFFLSKVIGKPLAVCLWPDKLTFFQNQKRGTAQLHAFSKSHSYLTKYLYQCSFPIVDVPFYIFFTATFIGLIPAAYVTVRAGIALGELRSLGDLYDFQSIATLFLIGVVSITPTLLSKNKS